MRTMNFAIHFFFSLMIALLSLAHTTYSQILGPTSVCTGECYTYTYLIDPSNSGIEVGYWEISTNDTTFMINANPINSLTICFEAFGNYQINAIDTEDQVLATTVVFARDFTEAELQIVSPASCRDQRPFQQSCFEVCEGTEVTFEFRDLAVLHIDWWFDGHGEITSSGNDHLRIQFKDGPGNAWIGYYGSVSDNCFFEGGTCVTIVEKTPAGFTTFPDLPNDSITLCKGQSIHFENTSTAKDINWFAPGLSSTQGSYFTLHFEEEGVFEISQSVEGACGCEDSKSIYVNVLEEEAAPIFCVGSVCEGDTVRYTSHEGCQPYFWNIIGEASTIGGGGENDDFIQLVWTGGSSGLVSLSTGCSASCFNPTEEIVYILGKDTRIKGPPKICVNEVYLFSVPPRDGTTFNWQVQNGHIHSGQNTHQIKASFFVSATDTWVAVEMEDCTRDCRVSDTLLLERTQPFFLNGPSTVCPGQEALFEVTSPGLPINALWQVLDQSGNILLLENNPTSSFSFVPDVGGFFTIIAYPDEDYFCQTEAELKLRVADSFSEHPSISGEGIVCSNNPYRYFTIIPPGTGLIPEWEITNGAEVSYSFQESVWITWQEEPDNRIRLRWVDGFDNCIGEWIDMEITFLNEINIRGPQEVCSFSEVIYSLENEASGQLNWSIPNPNSGIILGFPTDNSVRVRWKGPGLASLQAEYCGITAELEVVIKDDPVPELSDQLLCKGESAIIGTVEDYVLYNWYEKGHQVCNDPVCELSPGSYLLVVEDSLGCSGKKRFELEEVVLPPFQIFNLDPAGICEGDTTRLISTYPNDPDYLFEWYLNGSLLLSGTDTLFAIDTGNYELVLTHVATSCERRSPVFVVCRFCEDGLVLEDCSLPDRPGPGGGGSGDGSGDAILVDIEIQDNCNHIRLIANSTDLIDSTVIWRICDGDQCNYVTGNPASYVFQNSGSQLVSVGGYAQDSAGNPVLLRAQLFYIDIFNELDFNFSLACEGDPVQFESFVFLNPTDGVVSYEWDFGDPASGALNVSNLENPTHLFSNPGTYDVTLRVVTISGCELILPKSITVLESPEAFFEITDLPCTNSPVSAFAASGDGFFSWNFDGLSSPGNIDDINNPATFTYENPGTYQVELALEALNGCKATHTEIIHVHEFITTALIESPDDFPRCENDFAELMVSGGSFEHYLWSNGSDHPTITAVGSGPFYVTVEDVNGCQTVAGPFIPDYLQGPPAEIAGRILSSGALVRHDTLFVCFGSAVEIIALTLDSGIELEWFDGSNDPRLRYDGIERAFLSEGVHIFNLSATTIFGGCTSNASPFYVVVNPVPEKPILDSDPGFPLCAGEEIELFVTNVDPLGTYHWNNGLEGSILTTTDAGNYTVRSLNEYLCFAESDAVTIHPFPNIDFFPKGCLEICDKALICLPTPSGYTLVDWQLNGISETLPSNPGQIEIEQSGRYSGVFINSKGCAIESKPIEIYLYDGTGEISGMVFGDLDGDLIFGPGDTLFENIKIELWLEGVLVDSTFSGIGGSYKFLQKELGAYRISIDSSSLPEGWLPINLYTDLILTTCGLHLVAEPLVLINCIEETQSFQLFHCSGDTLDLYGIKIFQDTLITFIFDGLDCEQVEEYTVSFFPDLDTAFYSYTACHGDSIIWHGAHFYSDTTLILVHQNHNGCDSVEQFQLRFMPEMEEFISVLLCPGESYAINGENFESDTTLLRFILDDDSGCLIRSKIEITARENFNLLAKPHPACPAKEDGFVEIDWASFPGFDYLVFLGDTLFEPIDFSELSTGFYEMEVFDIYGCSDFLEWIIPEWEPLDALLEDVELQCDGEPQWLEVEVKSGEDAQLLILWNNGQSGPGLWVDQPGRYTAEVSNQCQSLVLSAEALLPDGNRILNHYVPNAFSPNEDGINDLFRPFFPTETRFLFYNFRVFDRWGNAIFHSDSPDSGWNGIYNAQVSDQAVFVWILEAEIFMCGEIQSIFSKGDVSVMR
ncbi:MAG: PKD domain-containing protein [Saprospirales bacterium]|nr:MAG: PKD domain-containing protein [Saprospirales bacterium]